jgi:sec-independent protein translocase protein TatA
MPPPRGHNRRGSLFHALVLASGFVIGGLLTQVGRRFLPPGAAKEFFTTGVTPSIGPLPIDLIILKFALGPIALDVSLLSLLGVLVAYLKARSLFEESSMFCNMGFPELLFIMVVILLLFGAKRIPEIAGSMGKGIREFKKNINEASREITAEPRPSLEDTQARLTPAELERRRAAAEETERAAPKRLL